MVYSKPGGMYVSADAEGNENAGKAQTLSTLQIDQDIKKLDVDESEMHHLRNVNTNHENLKVNKS